jgi:phage tail-like protein
MDFLFEPSPTSRFITTFIFGGIPSPLDIAFQRISGLSRELDVTAYSQGGENASNLYLANKVKHGTLVLERGIMPITPLTLVFDQVMQGKRMIYADVVILLLNHMALPICSWTISNALPVRWQTAALDAAANTLSVNTLELRYQDMSWLGIKA